MQSYVYVIASSELGPCKIGHSNNPERRLKQLQTGHSETLRIFHKEAVDDFPAAALERVIHETIGYKRARGEWFAVSTEEAIAEIRFGMIAHSERLSRKNTFFG